MLLSERIKLFKERSSSSRELSESSDEINDILSLLHAPQPTVRIHKEKEPESSVQETSSATLVETDVTSLLNRINHEESPDKTIARIRKALFNDEKPHLSCIHEKHFCMTPKNFSNSQVQCSVRPFLTILRDEHIHIQYIPEEDQRVCKHDISRAYY